MQDKLTAIALGAGLLTPPLHNRRSPIPLVRPETFGRPKGRGQETPAQREETLA